MNTPFPPGAQVAAYFRDSGGNLQDMSVAQQQAAVGAWCKEHGLVLARVFADVARSGLRADREQFQAMIRHFANGAGEAGVVVWEYARISRDLDDLQYYVADLRRAGYVVHSMTDNIPPGLDGRLLENIIAWKNAKYIADLRQNVRRGMRYGATVHHAFYGGTPVGYKLHPLVIGKRRDGSDHLIHQLIPDPQTAPLVRKAYELRAGGATFAEIDAATHLLSWQASYSGMLSNPIYLGRRMYGEIVIEDFCQPLVERDIWEAAQRTNKAHDYEHGGIHPRVVRSRFFLTGLLRCGKCGMTMNGRVVPGRKPEYCYDYYQCQSYSNRKAGNKPCGARLIRKEALEGRVLQSIKERVLQPDVLSEIYGEMVRQAEAGESDTDLLRVRIKDELSDVTASLGRVVAAIREAGHSPALLAELAALEARRAELSEQLAALDYAAPVKADLDMAEVVTAIAAALDDATDEQRGVILRGFVTAITAVRGDGGIEGEIVYALPVDGAGGDYSVCL